MSAVNPCFSHDWPTLLESSVHEPVRPLADDRMLSSCSAIQFSQHEPRIARGGPDRVGGDPARGAVARRVGEIPTMTSGVSPLNVHPLVQQEFAPPFSELPSSQSSPASTTPLHASRGGGCDRKKRDHGVNEQLGQSAGAERAHKRHTIPDESGSPRPSPDESAARYDESFGLDTPQI